MTTANAVAFRPSADETVNVNVSDAAAATALAGTISLDDDPYDDERSGTPEHALAGTQDQRYDSCGFVVVVVIAAADGSYDADPSSVMGCVTSTAPPPVTTATRSGIIT